MSNDKTPVSSQTGHDSTPFSNLNYILFAIGLIVITAGWFFLRAGHISISPVMIILGYCVIIPIAIILKPGDKKKNTK